MYLTILKSAVNILVVRVSYPRIREQDTTGVRCYGSKMLWEQDAMGARCYGSKMLWEQDAMGARCYGSKMLPLSRLITKIITMHDHQKFNIAIFFPLSRLTTKIITMHDHQKFNIAIFFPLW
ncbi:hypothetical protein [Okeania sp. KiyG1]|uniref:hypothetical protein n=1 Tax=Okeania sp. KiyG1 TaxID=2720165 RepID=UPI001F23FC78|nr:hypothetical protein [Okeania sp. KiyG1]